MKFTKGQRLKVRNLNDLDPEYVDEYDALIGAIVTFTGRTKDEVPLYNDLYDTDDQEYDTQYQVEYEVDDTTDTVYLFKHNMTIEKRLSPPKTEIEWLDRVQANFKE